MQSKVLIIALIVLSLACSALIGWICVLTGQPVAYAIAPVALFLLVLLVLFIFTRVSARMAANQLEKGLLAQADAQARSARPDQKQQVVALQRDFEKAVGDLKTSKLGRAGRDALYLLPWYAIIGPSGAGKTTALRHSGLRFPSTRGQDNFKVKGVGGTRNCDFWLTNDAVLLDTAGRWSTQQDDHHEWLGFLQLLRKHRTKKPLNGMIAAIGIGDVVNASDEEIDILAEHMRTRLEEVVTQLRVSIPVYVLFTKCDLVEGFIDMFGGLRSTEREQILGFTLPLSRGSHSPDELFEDYFEELADNLRSASYARMGEERGARERKRVYTFPDQFRAMRDKLARFTARLFENSVYSETVPLRGVYFSSGTQEGRPFNLLFEESSHAEHEVVDQKGYFLRDLFMQVIFADSAIASASQAELRRQRIVSTALTSLLALVTLVIGVIPATVFLRSRHQINSTNSLVEQAEREAAGAARTQPSYSDAARALFSDLAGYERGAPSFFTSLGMYTGSSVVPSLRQYFAFLLRRELVAPVVSAEAQAMTDFGLRYEAAPRAMPTPAEHDTYYNALKMHLLLTMPKMPQQYASWVEQRLAEAWQAAAPKHVHAELARAYVDYAQLYPELAFTTDSSLVRRVRATLNRTSAAQQTLDAIVTHVSSLGYDLDLPKLTGYNTALIGGKRIRGAFTRRGYENAVRDLFATGAPEHVDELWVLGLNEAEGTAQTNQNEVERAARLAELSSLYFRTYVQEWRGFIDSVRTKAAQGGNSEALALLTELTSGVPTPLGRLFQGVGTNVRLPPPPKLEKEETAAAKPAANDLLTKIWKRDKPGAAKQAAKAKPVIEQFGAGDLAAAFDEFISFGVASEAGASGAPVPLDSYREQLVYLRDALQARLNEPGDTQQLESKIETALTRVRGLIEAQPPGYRPVFEGLLWPPIKGLKEGARGEGAAWHGKLWCSDVVAPYEQSLLGHYPFNPGGTDARIEDIDAYYKPGEGLLWKFTAASLAEIVQLSSDHYEFTPKYASSNLFNGSLLEFLDRSRDISRAFFAGNAATARSDFSVRLHSASSNVDTITLSVGGKQISYDNGPLTWQNLSWPGAEPAKGSSFMVRGRNVKAGNEIAGIWGFFRLLETGAVGRVSEDTVSVTWRLPADDVAVWIELRPNNATSPFFNREEHGRDQRLLRVVRGTHVAAPRRIAASQSVCKP
ncbi:MAG TPA: type VI secretion system membrane subunit TssM [Polyangiales bacterium]|nr:type VI secretion system membrane subunit TssM [Polyangiales bacterium]